MTSVKKNSENREPVVIYEDNHLLGIVKPAGLLVQGDRTGDPTALEWAKAYLKEKYAKPGNVFVGLVHRIDRPVSGVVLFARTSKAASRLARAFQTRSVEKRYMGVVAGGTLPDEGRITSYLERTHLKSRIASAPSRSAKQSELDYRVMARGRLHDLVECVLHTGRHHQIRLQLAHEGAAIVGDLKYGAPQPLPDKSIALHAGILRVAHPVRDVEVELAAAPPSKGPWAEFQSTLRDYFN